MAFTKGRWEAYTQHTDGTEYAILPLIASGTVGFAKVAAGDYAATIGSAITAELVYKMPAIIRYGEPHLEDTLLASQATTGPSYEQYNPPTGPPYTIPGLSANDPLPVLKGVKLKSIDVIYSVGTDPLTSITVGIYAKQDMNGQAPTITTLLAQAANGLSTAVTAERNVTNVAIPASAQAFIVTEDTVITVEIDITTPTGGSANIFGVVFNYDFNFN